MKKNPLVGVVASIIIILCGIYIGTTVKNSDWLTPQTAASINSQLAPSKTSQNNNLSAQELYSIVKQLNSEIEKTISGTEKVETKTIQPSAQKSVSTGGVVAVPQDAVQAKKLDDNAVKGAATGPIDQEKLHRQLIERKNFLTMLAKTDPRLFLLSSLSTSVAAKIPETFRSELERNVTVTGVIDVIQFDDFDHPENSHLEYSITVGNEKSSLYITNDLFVTSGKTFKVIGKKIGNSIVAENKDIEKLSGLDGPGDDPTPESVGEQKTLVLLIKFPNSPSPQPIKKSDLYDRIFNGNFQKFYKEQSYKKVSFNGDVLGWYTAQGNCETSYNNMLIEARNIVTAEAIDLTGYDRLILVPQNCSSSYIYGESSIGKTYFLQYHLSVGVVPIIDFLLSGEGLAYDLFLSHEMGHGLGAFHASGLDCGDVSYTNNCVHLEYGNYFDDMGGGNNHYYSEHFSANIKEGLGWISSPNMISIATSGRYTINPLETQSPGQKNFAKIKIPGSDKTYYLEFRKGIGFDSSLNLPLLSSNQLGLFVNIMTPYIHLDGLHLLDMSPSSASWSTDTYNVTLNVGREFVTENGNLTIGPVIEANNSGITFDVNMRELGCIRNAPALLTFINDPYVVSTGVTYSIQTLFKNQDSLSCTESKFNVEQTGIPSSWQPVIVPPGDVILSPGSVGSENVNFRVPVGTQNGVYPFTYTVKNETTGNMNSHQVNLQVMQSPVIYAISPPSGSIGTDVAITGQYFSSNPRVILAGSQGYFGVNLPSNGSNVSVQIPPFITGYNCNCQIPTSPGFYDISVVRSAPSYGFSNFVPFQVTQ